MLIKLNATSAISYAQQGVCNKFINKMYPAVPSSSKLKIVQIPLKKMKDIYSLENNDKIWNHKICFCLNIF